MIDGGDRSIRRKIAPGDQRSSDDHLLQGVRLLRARAGFTRCGSVWRARLANCFGGRKAAHECRRDPSIPTPGARPTPPRSHAGARRVHVPFWLCHHLLPLSDGSQASITRDIARYGRTSCHVCMLWGLPQVDEWHFASPALAARDGNSRHQLGALTRVLSCTGQTTRPSGDLRRNLSLC